MTKEPGKEEKYFDIRTVEKNLKRGLVTKQELDKFVKGLDDSKDHCAEIQVFEETKDNNT
ncbi:MAG: hypothetical protein HYS22_00355 [Deltaproteobacteria bacterium]|nr:hypothetical protein [Deltaproteobacteria bacterium]